MSSAAGELIVWTSASMTLYDINNYFKKMEHLRHKYASEIKIHIGFELDYFSSYQSWTTDFLNEYGSRIDDGILSVHFLEGKFGLRGIDYSFEEYKNGVVDFYGGFQQAQKLYYTILLESLEADLGVYKPTRLGHISLCQKFERYFEEPITYPDETQLLIHNLLKRVKEKNYSLDLNSAGYYKEGYQQSYPQPWITLLAKQNGIPLVFGSDAHSLDTVGMGYERLDKWLND